MTNSKKVVLAGVAIVAILFVGVAASRGASLFGGNTSFQKQSFLEGFYAGVGRVFEVTRTGVLNTSGVANFNALVTLNAGQLKSYPNSTTTTATTYTLVAADIVGYD